ncbi:hypothetical protein [Ramlibacter sp.]|uniref:hypothetical protein n=1 Tax=Ramlibacter sp. TaxID=1917967 RepID=UPI002FC5E50B
MERTFRYTFEPAALDPVKAPLVKLDVGDIEDAALREVLQTPGPALGTWNLLDALLTRTGANTPFVFQEPLGQAREVKVALSGLLGRFVARAYLERYFGLSAFAHLGKSNLVLDPRRRISVVRMARGDLPDWVACSATWTTPMIAEAKGCHDRGGPGKALARAWLQTQRVAITHNGAQLTVKRIAVATRWASAKAGTGLPMMAVQDPIDSGKDLSPEDERAMVIGLLRRHLATLLAPLGHSQLSSSLVNLTSSRRPEKTLIEEALKSLENTRLSHVAPIDRELATDGLVGGTVTRLGVVAGHRLSRFDEKTLTRLDLRPRFIGVSRRIVRTAILGHDLAVEGQRSGLIQPPTVARGDEVKGWIIPLDSPDRF